MGLFKDARNINRIEDQDRNIKKLAEAIEKDDFHSFLFRDKKETI